MRKNPSLHNPTNTLIRFSQTTQFRTQTGIVPTPKKHQPIQLFQNIKVRGGRFVVSRLSKRYVAAARQDVLCRVFIEQCHRPFQVVVLRAGRKRHRHRVCAHDQETGAQHRSAARSIPGWRHNIRFAAERSTVVRADCAGCYNTVGGVAEGSCCFLVVPPSLFRKRDVGRLYVDGAR